MKIAFVLSRDPLTSGGGVRSYIKNVSLELLKRKVKITIISPKETKNSVFEYIDIGSKPKNNIVFLLRLLIKAPFIKLASDSIICANRADFLFPFVLFHKNRLKGILIHGTQYEGVKEKGKIFDIIYSYIEKFAIKNSDFIIFVCKQSERDYKHKYPFLFKNKRSIIIPVGIDTNNFRVLNKEKCRKITKLPLNKKIIISVGRFNPEKRYDLALKSFQKVLNKNKNCLLVLVGEGPERNKIESLSKQLDVNNNLIFTGLIDHNLMPYYLNSADIFLLCSDREGSPNVIKEALACGLPIISAKVGDVSEVITKYTGVLVDKDNINMLSNAILNAIVKKWNQKYMLEKARQLTWGMMVKKMIVFYDKLLKESNITVQ